MGQNRIKTARANQNAPCKAARLLGPGPNQRAPIKGRGYWAQAHKLGPGHGAGLGPAVSYPGVKPLRIGNGYVRHKI